MNPPGCPSYYQWNELFSFLATSWKATIVKPCDTMITLVWEVEGYAKLLLEDSSAQDSFLPKTRTFSSPGPWAASTWKRLETTTKNIYRVMKQATMISQALKSAGANHTGKDRPYKNLKLRQSCYFASILLPLPHLTYSPAIKALQILCSLQIHSN